jgi:uncharacterized protein (DUF697 family)
VSSKFQTGFEKIALIGSVARGMGKVVGGVANTIGRGLAATGRAVVRTQGEGIGGKINTALLAGGMISDGSDFSSRLNRAQNRFGVMQ